MLTIPILALSSWNLTYPSAFDISCLDETAVDASIFGCLSHIMILDPDVLALVMKDWILDQLQCGHVVPTVFE